MTKFIYAPGQLPVRTTVVIGEDEELTNEVESVFEYLYAGKEAIDDETQSVAIDWPSMEANPDAYRLPLPVGQPWGWLRGTEEMRKGGLEQWTIDAASYSNQCKMAGEHPSLGCGLRDFTQLTRTHQTAIASLMDALEDETSKQTFAAIIACDFVELAAIFGARVFSTNQYFDGLRIDKESRVLNVGIHTGWDMPYWMLQTEHVVSVDPVPPQYMTDYALSFTQAIGTDLNITALDSYTGKCHLPVSDDHQAMGGFNGCTLPGQTTHEFDCVSLDDFTDAFGAFDIIKMDTEGAERNILWGGRNCLKQMRPQMALSIYHRPDDFWEIPLWVMRHLERYKLFIRPYSFTGNETIVYCIPEETETPEGLK